MCLVYIAQDSIRRGLYCSPVPGAICGGKAAVFYGVCVWRRLVFWHSFKFLPGFAVRIKMCSCSWVLEGACGNQQKVVTGKPLYIWPVYAQPKLRGIYQAYTRYILPPPRYISPTTWGRNEKNSLSVCTVCARVRGFCKIAFDIISHHQVKQLLMQLLPDVLAAWLRVAQPNDTSEYVLQLQVMPGKRSTDCPG